MSFSRLSSTFDGKSNNLTHTHATSSHSCSYAQDDFNAVSSTEEMNTVRSWGYSSQCIREKMLNHAFKGLFGNVCGGESLSETQPWNYEMFSCTPCDKTSPNSCVDSVRALEQQTFTGFAAFGFLLRSMADAYGYVCATAVVVFEQRVVREQNARKDGQKRDAKRSLMKIAKKCLTREYKCVTMDSKKGLDLEPNKWNVKINKILSENLFKQLLIEVEAVAGSDNWNPSFFPPGVFRDSDNIKYKLLSDEDRRSYMDEVVARTLLSNESKED